uniref:Uncharacterized protein n=1 Tax=Alexandrium monilatum TaxID=311494 RepID=A0A7S4R2V4_9DINO|mmetsp:Transcript_23811/g.75461  ORF Transcript_23811/g.75461 Transcript_23811/m.75461 type:complete len:270 (-) Transcript_23811:277-1086(-)
MAIAQHSQPGGGHAVFALSEELATRGPSCSSGLRVDELEAGIRTFEQRPEILGRPPPSEPRAASGQPWRVAAPAAPASSSRFCPEVFVTGGQTGADSIPFTVYRRLGASVAGYLPQGFKRNDGRGREIAEEHGLQEGEGGYSWRDKANAAQSDACLAFLTTKPLTGRGTMQTVNSFVNGEYAFVVLAKPEAADHLAIAPAERGRRPVLVLWNISEERLDSFAEVLCGWLGQFRPRRLMFSGMVEDTWPGVERLGAELLLRACGSAVGTS